MSVYHICIFDHGDQKIVIRYPRNGVTGSWEPPDVGTGPTSGSSARTESTLNHWAISAAPRNIYELFMLQLGNSYF